MAMVRVGKEPAGSWWPPSAGTKPPCLMRLSAARDAGPGVIFHSDRGCRYTSAAYAALAEGVDEFVRERGETLAEAKRAVVEYIAW
jgi:transposase InsO family protein